MRVIHRLTGGLAALLLVAAASASAFAQVADQPAPPVNVAIDPRGVDLPTGKFIYSTTEAVIGQPGQGGISYGRIFVPVQGAGGGGWRDVLMGSIGVTSVTNEIIVSIGSGSEIFVRSGTTYTPKRNVGSTLAQSGTTFTYTASSGAVATFIAAPANNISLYDDGIASLSSVRQPNGERMDYVYREESVCISGTSPNCSIYKNARRIQSITSNRGYQIHYDYLSQTPWLSSGWSSKIKVTAFNLASEYCAPTAVSCTFAINWPSVTYDATGATDQSGLLTAYTYSADNLSGVRLPGSSSNDISIVYDANERVQSITSSQGAWTYTYTDNNPPYGSRTTVATGPLGQKLTGITPLTTGLLAVTLDVNSAATSYGYDSEGRVTRVTQPEGNYTAWHYDGFGNIDTITQVAKNSGPGSGANIVYQATYPTTCTNAVLCHRPTSTTDPLGNVTDYTWDGTHGGLLTVTEPAPTSGANRPQTRATYSQVYAYYRNASGNIVQAPSSITLPTTYSQCASGVAPACVGTANELRTTMVYGSNGVANNLLPTSVTRANGPGSLSATQTATYVANGDPEYVDGPLSGTTDRWRYFWNVRRQLEGVVGPDGAGAATYRAVRYTYGSRGLATLSEAGSSAGQSRAQWEDLTPLLRTAITYDGYGRMTRRAEQTGAGVAFSLQQTSYDAAGRPSCVAVRMNTATYDSLPSSACTASSPVGADGADRITQYSYNTNGQLGGTIAAYGTSAAQSEAVTYTANGQVASITDGEGNVSGFAYTRHDQLYRLYYPNPSGSGTSTTDFEEYTYDSNGNVTEFQNRSGQDIHYTYDFLDRVTLLDPQSMSDTTYEWDNIGRPLKARFGTSHVITNVWDALDNLTSQAGRGGTLAYQYDLAGNRTRITWPGGSFYVAYGYDAYGAVTLITQGGGSTLASYTYNDLGNPLTVTRANSTSTAYAWNANQQLASIAHNLPSTANDLTLSFTYNAAGQIRTRTRSNTAYSYGAYSPATVNSTIDGLNRVTQQGSATVGYDTRGEITSDGARTYTYNALNQLTAAASPAATLGYDPEGRLYSLTDASTDVRLQYDDLLPVTEFSSNDTTVLRRHIPSATPGLPLLTYEGTGTSTQSWYIADDLGSVVNISNSSGSTSQINSYDEYGVPASGNGGRFQYTGQMRLPGSLHHYQTRAYSPALGRFLQPDLLGYAAGANLYAYVGADPINFTDPLGLMGFGSGRVTFCFESNQAGVDFSNIQRCTTQWDTGGASDDIFGWAGFLWLNSQGSIYDHLYRPNIGTAYDNPQFAEQDAAYRRNSAANAWMAIPALAPAAVPILAEVGAVQVTATAAKILCKCFEAGTQVHTADGLKTIEDIAVGDLVIARDDATGETALKPVTALIRVAERQIWEVTIVTLDANGEARSEIIGTTGDHPWRLVGGEWSETAELEPGFELVSLDGYRATVASVVPTDRTSPTFNLEVDEFHTYFVGSGGIWVHNACDPGRLTYLYQKISAAGQHLKIGITSNPLTRYTRAQLAGGRLRIIASGRRDEMLALERHLHRTLPRGPQEGSGL